MRSDTVMVKYNEYFISRSKLTLSASPCVLLIVFAARLRVMFDLEMKLDTTLVAAEVT